MKDRSFKFKITLAILMFVIVQGVALPIVFDVVQKKIISSYETQNINEQRQIFEASFKTYITNLGNRATSWFSTKSLEPLTTSPRNIDAYKDNLLGLGNGIAGSHDVKLIQTFDLNKVLVVNYPLTEEPKEFKKSELLLQNLIATTIEAEGRRHEFLSDDTGTPYVALAIPSEDEEEEEVNFIHIYYVGLGPLLNKFSSVNNYPTSITMNGTTVHPSKYKKDLLAMEAINGQIFSLNNKVWNKRKIPVSAKKDQDLIFLSSYVDITQINESLSTIQMFTNGGFIVLCLLFFVSFFIFLTWLVKPLNGIFSDFKNVSSKVGDMSQSLLQSTNKTMHNIDKESASVASTVSAAEEITAMLSRSKTLSNETTEYSNESRLSAEKGLGIMKNMLESLKSLEDTNKNVLNTVSSGNKKIGDLLQVIEEIAEKTGIINDITFQTKLLSFNASVEAARAGEHGKGFAVVAEEVGNLARMSSEAAQDINGIVERSMSQVKTTLESVKAETESILDEGETQLTKVSVTGKSAAEGLSIIVANFSKVDSRIKELKVAIDEQTTAVESISQAMREIQISTDQNRDFSKSNSSAASALEKESDEIVNSVSSLEHLFLGKNNGHHDTHSPTANEEHKSA